MKIDGKRTKQEPDDIIQPPPSPPKKDTQIDEKVEGKDEHLERSLESKPPEKVVIHDDHLDQTIIVKGNLSVKCRFELIEILRKHADAFTWTPADKTGIPHFIAEHELKTYHHIEPRVQRKRNIAPDQRRVVKDEVAEWLKAGIVRKANVDDMVIKSKTELKMIKDIKETLLTVKKVNMKLNSKKMFLRNGGRQIIRIYSYFRRNQSKSRKSKGRGKHALTKQPETNAMAKRQTCCLEQIPFQSSEKGFTLTRHPQKCTNKRDFHWTTEAEFQEIKRLIMEIPTLTAPKKEEEHMVYLSATNEAVNAILLVKRHGRQAPIHYFDRRKKQEASETKTPENLGTKTDIWKLYTDGASNEHGSRAGLILIDLEGIEYSYALRLNFAKSNNDAKYEALLAGLRIATKIKVKNMHAFADLKLVASQVEGSYEAKVRKPIGLTKGVLIEELNERLVDTAEVNAIIEEATRTWMTLIQENIEHEILPEDVAEA
uniref:Uncharacterized protein n=1 Tax=Tanacetum cinerariifolium TaxID=118510 RepID=A0A6L2P9D3_TANCI|nr:hypothetical protein [Tanacetum cinerariifolium]